MDQYDRIGQEIVDIIVREKLTSKQAIKILENMIHAIEGMVELTKKKEETVN